MQLRKSGLAASSLVLALVASAVAGDLSFFGDGSATNNADFSRSSLDTCAECIANPPSEWGELPYDVDWSIGLRGGIRDDGNGDGPTLEVLVLPTISLVHQTMRGGYDLGLTGEVEHALEGDPRIGTLTATAGGTYLLDADTALEGRTNLTVSQDDPNDPDYPPGVAQAPLEVFGDIGGTATRAFGPLTVALTGRAGRQVYGDTILDDDTTINNDYQNTTNFGAGGRVGYEFMPGIRAFVDGQAFAELYDVPSPTLLVKLDNTTYEARTGLAALLEENFELEGSLGIGYRDFADETLEDFSTVLYGASAAYRPNDALEFVAALTTTISSPGDESGATAAVEYAADAELSWLVNNWLRMRVAAGWSETHYQGIDNDEYEWGFGIGADYLLNENTDLTADYNFNRTELTPDPGTSEHEVTIGVLFHR